MLKLKSGFRESHLLRISQKLQTILMTNKMWHQTSEYKIYYGKLFVDVKREKIKVNLNTDLLSLSNFTTKEKRIYICIHKQMCNLELIP